MEIRRMQIQDILPVSKVHKTVFSRQQLSKEWITCNFHAYPRIRYYIAEEEGNIFGYIQWTEKSGFRKEVVLELEQIAVLPSHQKRGIGTALILTSLEMVKRELKKREASIKHIIVSTRVDNEAQKLYKNTLKAQPEAVLSNLFSADEVLMIARDIELPMIGLEPTPYC